MLRDDIATSDGLTFYDLETPCLLLDRSKVQSNIARLRAHLAPFDVVLRPHLKTAKSIDVARLAMTSPSGPAMVSTLKEADYFARNGVTDLIYGVGISPAKFETVAAIERTHGAKVAILIDCLAQAHALAEWSQQANHSLDVFIEIDCDGHRSGVAPDNRVMLEAIGQMVSRSACNLRGVLTHAGESYSLHDADTLAGAAERERCAVVLAANTLRAIGLQSPHVSIGSTPTAHFTRNLDGVTEVRAGVFMFGDLFQAGVGVLQPQDIAVSVLATVIGHRQSPDRIIVDAGWMAMSRDRSTQNQAIDQAYGLVCDLDGAILHDVLLLETNQEHGSIGIRQGSHRTLPDLAIGQRVRILPNHACATCAQHDSYQVCDAGQAIIATWPRISGW
jgi:D-serine deaminase-like pyridoxal phosphate-dependent protein